MKEAGLQHYLDLAERFQAERAAGAPAWLRALRQDGIAQLARQGFPSTKLEDWKYTNVAPISDHAFCPVRTVHEAGVEAAVGRLALPGTGPRLVFVDGWFVRELSRLEGAPEGLTVRSLREALQDGEPLESLVGRRARAEASAFTALNAALLEEGALVRVAPGTVCHEPVQLLFVTRGDGELALASPRVVVQAGENSELTLVESYVGAAPGVSFTNAVTEVVLGDGARLTHLKLQAESESAFHIGGLHVEQGRDSRFASHLISLGGALARNEVHALFSAEGGEATLNGLYVGHGTQHLDQWTNLDHAQPRCTSRELYKGVLDDKARGTFHGKVMVRPDAQQTDARQANRNLLLSEAAMADARPQLEILADDVKCAHGATVGRLDEQALFYLRARGIPRAEAESLLTHAFATEVVGAVPLATLREQVEELLARKLPGAKEGRA
ncbi:Fe-S cluster assembly protein SufD [Vitiosangium sp. GDMCC 1.1324]|uniref:Fe-S cluster assembly protein SufD n=1 Tax=Vitiosangium sp. (strain GDMCC 1.1324) TaxID=2138576 RepID=UPI000D3AE158|nr:Fe-S cluster assembly protein SufD [Vitiosangium sp. GDMCC 1.1324]PTL82207.1 Fe-S cluster assembly protein SufD [Vitiosangium sp. GDMCC 1.1324]